MLKGEAINKAKKWRRKLEEGQALFVDKEELKQFLDVALEMLNENNEELKVLTNEENL